MQDFEIQRASEAEAAFQAEFDRGFDEGDQACAWGEAPRADMEPVSTIEVPRDDIHDGDWGTHLPTFREAGRRAGRAAGRETRTWLDSSSANDESADAFDRGIYVWRVVPSPSKHRR